MALQKIKAADAFKSDDGNDSLDTIIRQAIGKEPFLSFNRATDSPVQWIQWLHALDQQDVPGWPLLAPLKIQMQKCDKCSREFCSTINYRRHMRLHRRKLNLDKDSNTKNRELLQAFWDKVSVEEAMEIMSFDDVFLEGVTGSSIVTALTSLIRKPGFTSLPQAYLKSGSALLDIIQGRPSKFPISSQELFSIFDDASENTFVCAGTAESLQKYVFDGEAGKTGLEMRNLVACISFLAEQKLVRACLADKDAEALRYQKLLVEEEEAAQKRQAAILEKKRQKKLRKEQRARQLATAENDDSPEESSSPSTSSPPDALESTLELLVISHDATPSLDPVDQVNTERDIDEDEGNGYLDLGAQQNGFSDLGPPQSVDHRTSHRNSRRHVVNPRWQAPKSQRNPNAFHTNHSYHTARLGVVQKHAFSRESRAAAPNGIKVWTPKPKSETDEVWTPKPKSETDDDNSKPRLLIEEQNLSGQDKKHEVLIGSISVTIGNLIVQEQEGKFVGAPESRPLVHSLESLPDENSTLESAKGEVNQGIRNPTVKFCRPVTRQERGDEVSIQNSSDAQESGGNVCSGNDVVRQISLAENNSNGCEEKSDSSVEGGKQGGLKFSSHAAEAFLSQRWKEAITSEHVKLVLFPTVHSDVNDGGHEAALPSKSDHSGVLCSTDNRLPIHTAVDSSAPVKSKVRAKSEKGGKVKYIPKQGSAC